MFTEKAQTIIDRAKDHAAAKRCAELQPEHLLAGLGQDPATAQRLAEALGLGLDAVMAAAGARAVPVSQRGTHTLSAAAKALLQAAKDLAEAVPNREQPGLIDERHLAAAMAGSPEISELLGAEARSREKVLALLAVWAAQGDDAVRLGELADTLRRLRAELLDKVFGQEHAVHAFVEGLFNAEVVAAADAVRKTPRAIFVFAGPPGVGKTFLAEQGAAYLGRPFKRFDMSGFSGHEQTDGLVGMSKLWRGAHPGALTEFVAKNPAAVLLFDEIEKANISIIHLFLQILDQGALEDKFTESGVNFRDTTIIFTTNAGKKLYERAGLMDSGPGGRGHHRRTVLDSLGSEINPATGQPFFPAAICSRLAGGYTVLFNYLGLGDLVRVAQQELARMGALFERQFNKRFVFAEEVALSLVLREGYGADARTVRAQTGLFVKGEVFRFCQLFTATQLDEAIAQIDTVRFSVDLPVDRLPADVQQLFVPPARPRILLVADRSLAELYGTNVPEVEWLHAENGEDALQLLVQRDVDLVLLDPSPGKAAAAAGSAAAEGQAGEGAGRIGPAIELLRKIRQRLPEVAVFLLALEDAIADEPARAEADESVVFACAQAGGVRGRIESRFIDARVDGWREHRDELATTLIATAAGLHRERQAVMLNRQRKALAFDVQPEFVPAAKAIEIQIRNLRLARVVAAADNGEILDDVERPQVRFSDVFGAETVKKELGFFLEYLKNPRRFLALGLKVPRGVLLYGPPGTGKTMLARALAGESDLAFISVAATSLVTIWQGSGPQNVRDLFARARRYAPAIVFIDEIDAIGRMRTGGAGSGHSEEMALTALLAEMDGFGSGSDQRPIFVLAATNYGIADEGAGAGGGRGSRLLDPALVRRFSRAIYVDLPDSAARREFLARRLASGRFDAVSDETLALITEKSVGLSMAQLDLAIEHAGREALRRGTAISGELLLDALDTMREGEVREWSLEFLERTARHEAGHAVLYWLSGWLSPEVSIVARGNRGGGMRRAEAEMNRECLTKEELLAKIRVCMGGRAAEIVYYGKESGTTTGAAADLEQATQLARQMVCRYGMDDGFGLIVIPEGAGNEAVTSAAGRILNREFELTLGQLEAQRPAVDRIVGALLAKNRILGKELESLLPVTAAGA